MCCFKLFEMYKLPIMILFLLILNTFCEDISSEEEENPFTEISNDEYMRILEFSRNAINRHVTVNTRVGKIIGMTMESSVKGKSFYAFRGIPYALPPIGDLRFAAPISYMMSKERIIDASNERDICIQSTADINGIADTTHSSTEASNTTESSILTSSPHGSTYREGKVIGSEDCLYLNVYIPKIKRQHNLPVVVNIHGGAFLFGSGNYADFYGPDYLLNNSVIYVSFNYRLGALGFLATEDLVVPGNNGLKDQLLALQWIKDNIDAFGGDPNKITIMGQSAGGASVGYLLQSLLAKDLFKGAILLSGNTLSHWSLQRKPKENAIKLGSLLNIFANSSQVLISELRKKSAKDIVLATKEMGDFWKNPFSAMNFVPVKEPDHAGSVFSDRSYRILSEERLNAENIMIGYTSAEAIVYMFAYNPKCYEREDFLVPDDMNIIDPTLKTTIAEKVYEHYYGNGPINKENAIHFIGDNDFVRPSVKFMRLASKRNRIFGYKFTYQGLLRSANRKFAGVGHGEDISYIFKQSTEPSMITEKDALTRLRWCKLIGNFAWFGNPTPLSENILDNIQWRTVSETKDLSYLEFGENLVMNVKPNDADVQFWDNLYLYSNQTVDTY